MNIAEMRREPTVETLRAGTIDMKLEVVVIRSRTTQASPPSSRTRFDGSW
jgi:hypothetical protein